ncbi:adhesion G-protein coupled receptor G7 isoform X2 [Cebidichthys violaceus]|uniref:adhesion G-protein coupled receptor G7 isoform X2 n=1 Tax=Cebidichthys violaceus TaxID=271503 RepID=UPI0035CA1939
MNSLFLVRFTLAVHLASRTGAQSTPPSSITTVVTIPATTAIFTTTDRATNTTTTSDLTKGTDYPTTTTTSPTSNPSPITTIATSAPPPITTTSPTSNHPSIITTDLTNGTDYPTTTTTTADLTNGTDYPTTTTTTPTINGTDYPTTTTTTADLTNGTDYPTTTTTTPTINGTDYPTTTTTTTTTTINGTDYPTTTTTYPTSTPPPITTNATSAPPPLVCGNGGVSLNGVCICPDEWTGETCSVENFCRFQELGNFKFSRTPIGWFAYSEELCPKETRSAGKPKASTRCSTKNGLPSFQRPPRVLQCDQTLSDIQLNLTSPADFENLASSTQILTSKPEELTAKDITAAAQIANTLLLSPNASESVRVAAVSTVSQLLNAGPTDDSEENNATLGLTVTLDQLSVNLSLGLKASQSQVVQPNLVVQSARVCAADSQGVQFTSLSGTSGSFVADRIQLNTNTSTVVVENGFIADAVIYVGFPPVVSEKSSEVSLGFVLYQNDRFFRSRRYRRSRATIRVLSASVKGPRSSVVPQHVEMLFRPTVINGTSLFNFACVFWDYGVQDWSTDGCSKGNASNGLLRCSCNHTTNFAALWSFRENYEYAEALDVISIVGLSFSILALIVTIIHQLKQNFQKKDKVKDSDIALLCICVSLLAFIITFVTGVGNSSREDAPVEVDTQINSLLDRDEHVEPDGGSCSVVVAVLHFFLLATFMWNGLYATLLLLVNMDRSLPSYWTPLSVAVGWGVPAVIMSITLGATYRPDDPLGYRQEEFCWLAALDKNKQFHFGKPMFWGFLLPVGLILIYVTALLVFNISRSGCSIKRPSLWKNFLISYSLAMLLGLSWTLGYLVLVTTGTSHLIFSILFCLCTTTQGLQIFVLFTARRLDFRASVSRSIKYVSSIKLKHPKYRLQRNWTSTSSESYRDLKDFNESYRDLKDFNESSDTHL